MWIEFSSTEFGRNSSNDGECMVGAGNFLQEGEVNFSLWVLNVTCLAYFWNMHLEITSNLQSNRDTGGVATTFEPAHE